MSEAVPQICYLSHPGFRLLGEPVFRLSEGARVPSMVIKLDGQDAVLPLQSIAREFHVEPESADGQMLNLIEQALEFVVTLKLGDKLPSEINGGAASWEPNAEDRRVAASRVRHNFVRCVFARLAKSVTIRGGGLPGWEEEPQNRALLEQAFADAVSLLDGADKADITERIASICEEMAYIETMRRALTRGIASMRDKLLSLGPGEVMVSQRDTVKQVQTLAGLGVKEITSRFDEVDVHLDDILGMLRDLPTMIADLRHQRDWLFRTNRAWEAVFRDWAAAPNRFDEFLLKVVERTYIFLAPRYMSFQEWTSLEAKLNKQAARAKVW